MPNIVYVLTNPAMPGIVKIGMTDRDHVESRMKELYSSGVPFPFDCIIARQIEDKEAARVETALHTAFGPYRVNPSREFFEIDSEQAEALLQVMPGQDVTPRVSKEIAESEPEDVEVASEYKRRQARTNEDEFMASLNENGIRVYERVLSLGKQEGMHINWGKKGFTLNAVLTDGRVVICNGYPLSSVYNQQIYTNLAWMSKKANIPQEDTEVLRKDALNTGLFTPIGKGIELSCRTDRELEEPQLAALIGWLEAVIAKIWEYGSVSQEEGPGSSLP